MTKNRWIYLLIVLSIVIVPLAVCAAFGPVIYFTVGIAYAMFLIFAAGPWMEKRGWLTW